MDKAEAMSRVRFVAAYERALASSRSVMLMDAKRVSPNEWGLLADAVVLGGVRDLVVVECGVGPAGARALARAISAPGSRLRRLSLGNVFGGETFESNDVGDSGVAAIAAAVASPHSRLVFLDVAGNGVTDVGARALAQAFAASKWLACVSLENNPISDVGARALAEAVPTSLANVEHIELGRSGISNRVSPRAREALEEAIACAKAVRCPTAMGARLHALVVGNGASELVSWLEASGLAARELSSRASLEEAVDLIDDATVLVINVGGPGNPPLLLQTKKLAEHAHATQKGVVCVFRNRDDAFFSKEWRAFPHVDLSASSGRGLRDAVVSACGRVVAAVSASRM